MASSIQIWCSFFSENDTNTMEHKFHLVYISIFIWHDSKTVFFFFKNLSRFLKVNTESEGQRNISMLECQITAHLTDTYLITF